MNTITTTDLAAMGPEATIVDVREEDEFASARVAGATNVPLSALAARIDEIPRDRTVYVMCLSGGRSARATAFLLEHGIDVVNVLGGINQWHGDGLPIVTAA